MAFEDTNPEAVLTPQQRLARLLTGYRREIRYVLLYAVVIGLINLSLPLGVQAIIGLILGGALTASWGVLVFFILIGALLAGVLRLMQLSIMEHLQRRLFSASSIEFAVRIPRLNLESLNKEYLPELINRFFDTLTLQKGVPKILIDGSTAILQIVFSLLLLSFYHLSFVTFSFLLLFLLALLFYWTVPSGIKTSLTESKYKYRLAYWLEEVGRVAPTFKLAGENRFPLQRADALTADYLDARARHWRVLMIQFSSSVTFRLLILGSFLILGSLLVTQGQLNLGQFVAAEILIFYIIESVEKLILLHETGYDVLTATEKIGQVADLPLERAGGLRFEEFCDAQQPVSIELRGLSYHYPNSAWPTLQNIDLHIAPGERVAVAGYNASGKTTLMQILSVNKRDYSGVLLFNGLPKSNLHLRSLRDHIGDFSAQEDIFKGTLLENITLGRSGIGMAQVLAMLEEVDLAGFVRTLPHGIDTELLPGGTNTPGSVIRKILLARALVGRPNVLVMEEPLEGLNPPDRLRLARLLTDSRKPWTLVTVTEDPGLAAMCHRVVVLDNGQVIFDGPFEEVRQQPYYPHIFRREPETIS